MRINFRSKLFDVYTEMPEGTFRGEDVAKWFESQLSGWRTSVVGEDWGWAVLAQKEGYKYLFGIYDHDTDEVTEDGPIWVLRVFNRKDRQRWYLKLFKNVAPVAHEEVLAEVVAILKRTEGVSEVRLEPL